MPEDFRVSTRSSALIPCKRFAAFAQTFAGEEEALLRTNPLMPYAGRKYPRMQDGSRTATWMWLFFMIQESGNAGFPS